MCSMFARVCASVCLCVLTVTRLSCLMLQCCLIYGHARTGGHLAHLTTAPRWADRQKKREREKEKSERDKQKKSERGRLGEDMP
jgi:hypothetical protein